MALSRQLFSAWCDSRGLDIKSHQLDGFEWVMNRETGQGQEFFGTPGGFICDEMGLGKTILMIGAIVLNAKQHTLVVLPKCLLDQWLNAIVKFTALEENDVLVYHGAAGRTKTVEEIAEYRVVITTYGMIATRKPTVKCPNYTSKLWNQQWDRIIYDESHHLRNAQTGLFRGASRLLAPIKWMVTGTPINNRREDFYAQMTLQGSAANLSARLSTIRRVVNAIVLRRTKAQVGIEMPKLTEQTIEVEWESPEEELFVRNIHNLMSFAPVTPQNVNMTIRNLGTMYQSVFPLFMLMRQACVKPSMAYNGLFRRAIERDFDMDDFEPPTTSSKINAVVNKVVANRATRKSKLIFCLFRDEMAHIEAALKTQGFSPAVINGSTTKKQRRFALQAGLKNEEWAEIAPKLYECAPICPLINSFLAPNVLIAQIQTSCEGLNLQHFAEVYFTTPHWNPAVESQAIARCHRIGQKSEVDVYRFITAFEDAQDEASMSLDQYCMRVQQVKKEVAREAGLL
jgi:SNF2 family DNA or RNA helicase